MRRTDNTRLPGDEELAEILEREEFRPVAPGKEDVHYPDFTVMTDLLTSLSLHSDLFTEPVGSIYEAVRRGDGLLDQMVRRLVQPEIASRTRSELDACYAYLSEEDEPQPSDLIFVFGGKTLARPGRAAELYARDLAPTIMMSGGSPIYALSGQMTEARLYRGEAIRLGVPGDAILSEDKSITVPDNVRVSLNLLEARQFPLTSIIVVNSPYTQRRGWAIFKKHLPDSVVVRRVNCDTKPEFYRSQWYLQEPTLKIVLSEFMKMRASVVYNTA